MGKAPGLFDFDDRLQRLSDLGDQLEAFGEAVDFEMFRADLIAALDYSDGRRGGRPPFDPVIMFKVLMIQSANNLSDERAEFLINDRLSFRRFLGLDLADRVPDARTIWLFREKLTRAEAIEGQFSRVDAALRARGYIAMSGQIVDASLVSAPKQRNTTEERQALKEGRVPEDWKAKPAKLRHKDRDARWKVKFTKAKERADGSRPPVDIAIPTFGYQNHIGIDVRHGLIRTWKVTSAATYEGAELRQGLLDGDVRQRPASYPPTSASAGRSRPPAPSAAAPPTPPARHTWPSICRRSASLSPACGRPPPPPSPPRARAGS